MKIPLFLALLTLSALAQNAAPPAGTTPLPPMRETSPGVFEIGAMRLDKKAGTLTFPGALNMAKGLIEYLLVSDIGPTHESLLLTEVTPNDVHLAMLLLGAKGAGLSVPAPSDAPPAQIDDEYLKHAPKLKGDELTITVKWKDKSGAEKTAPVEDWVLNTETKKPAPRGPWLYTGSMFGSDGKFLADQQGLFAGVITNPAALIHNPRKGNDSDDAWAVNEKAVPPLQTPVEITIRLAPAKADDAKK